jgi:transposase
MDDENTASIQEVRRVTAANELRRGMSEPEAAKYIGIGLSTLRKKRRAGTAPRHYFCGRRPIYTPEFCDEWIEKNAVE